MGNEKIQVLLIEDNPLDVDLVHEMLALAKDAPFVIEDFGLLSSGLERLAEGGIDVLLLDLSLPDSRGLETFVKTHAQAPHVPIVVLSVIENEALAIEAVEKGAQDYLVKGQVDDRLLVRAVHYAIERKQAEEALRESENRYYRLFSEMVSGSALHEIICDDAGHPVDYTTLEVNKAYEAILGVKKDDVVGKRASTILPRDELEDRLRIFGPVALTGKPARYEMYSPFNQRYFEGAAYSPAPDQFAATFHDVTERIRSEQERTQAEEALQQYAERLRALATRLAEAEEVERQGIARELHDRVGQNLTALGINLNIVRSQMPEEAAQTKSRLDDSLALVDETTERIRNLMADLRPPVLDDYGLVAALRWHSERFASRTGIAVTVHGEEPDPRLAAHVENALFRIIQEALTNVGKHAQATQATVTVEEDEATVYLTVEDNGVGFEPADLSGPDAYTGWGLLTMAERAETVGGKCRVASRSGQGTQVIVEVTR